MSNQPLKNNDDEQMNKRIENLFSGGEPPSYLTISQVESLKQRITELENKLYAAETPDPVESAPASEKEANEDFAHASASKPSFPVNSGFHRITSLSRKILLPTLTIFAIAMAGFFFYSFYTVQVDNKAREAQDSQQAEEFLNSELNNMKNFALGLAIQSATNPDIQAAFAERDREALADLTLDTYKALDTQFDIPQYQFHLSPAISFLRLHNPESYGDDLSSFRFTVLEVNKTLKPVAGLEVGRGGMGMRGIMPMYYKGRHTGSVEFGLNIDDTFLARMKEEFGGDWRIILTKESLSLATLEDLSKLEEGPASNLLVLASTIDGAYAPTATYASALNGEETISRVRENGKTYSVTTLPLHDYTGKVIGTVDIVIDRTEIAAQQTWRIIFLIIAMSVALVAGSYSLNRTTSLALKPLNDLTRASEAIELGNLSQQVTITSQDEIGQLGYTFNRMTAQLQNLIGSLEQRVAERTHDLELAAEVGRTITEKVNNMDAMLSKAVDIIHARFNLYYTQIYLLDPFEETISLRAGTGEIGKQLLARGHRLKVGLNSINGRAVAEKRAIIVTDTEISLFFLKNELLPNTRSEMAVPLIVNNRVVGVLDMQSEHPNALNETNLPAFEALSGQLAVAIQNAILFEEAANARIDLEERAGRQSYMDWNEFLNAIDRGEKIGFASQNNKLVPIAEPSKDANVLTTPIQVIGVEIGKIQIGDNSNRTWSEDDQQVIQATAEQLSHHIENMRLLAQADKYRAEAEQAVKRLTREGWEEYLSNHDTLTSGFVYDRNQVRQLSEAISPESNGTHRHDIKLRDEKIGELQIAEPRTMQVAEAETLIQQITDNLSAHIETLRLTEQTQNALLTTEKLYDASRTLTAAQTELEALNQLVQRLNRTGLDRIVAALKVSNQPITAEVVSAWDYDGLENRSIGNRFTEHQLPLVSEIQPGIPVIFEDFDAPDINPLTQKVFKMQGVRSAAIIPISSNNEILGWLLLETTHSTRRFDTAIIQQYLAFADQVATVIQRQRLFAYTEAQRVEIQKNEARLAEALEIARLGNWEYDVEKDIFTFNDQFYSIFHTTAEEVGGYQLSSAQYAQKFVHPDDMPIVGVEIEKALSSTERYYSVSIEHRINYADGGVGYIAVNLNVERDENGKITRYYGANQDITERKLAEELIRTNEARLSEALEIARLGNWEYDFEKDLFTFNDNFYSVFRTNVQEVGSYQMHSAEYAQRFVHPEDAALVGEEIGKAMTTTERHFNQKLEHRIIFPDGSLGYISVNIHVERDENGKIVRWYGANQDITERKMAELELERLFTNVEQSQALLRSIIDATPDWIFVKDKEHRYQLVNQGYANALHIPSEEFIGKNDLDLGFPEELVKGAPEKGIRGFWADDQLVLETNETQIFPDDPATIDGVIHTFHTIKTPLKDTDGKPQAVLAFARDITERRLAENIIAERANQLETVATVSTTASTVLNPDDLLQTVVDLTKERFALYHTHIYLADEDWNTLLLSAGAGEVGRKMVSAGHAIQMDAQRSLVARAARERQAVIVNDIHTDVGFLPNPLLPDTHAEMAVPMIVGDKVLGVFDVQSEKSSFFTEEDALIYNTLAAQVAVALQNARLYQTQAATLTQLRELDRLKSSFLANMSHELRTPLNSILGFTDVMLEGLDGTLTPYMQNDLALIQKNGQHLLHLINDVLDMAKIESGKLNLIIEKFQLQEVIEEVMSITSPLANEKKLILEIDSKSESEIEISADRTRLRQVLLNLVNNAAKFTDNGKISIRALREANNILISIKDTGIGIPPSHLESIFQEFTQVDSSTTRKAGGTGLGLPISRRLIQMHGGRLWAESSGIAGEGSAFYVFLPIEAKIAEPEITTKR